MAAVVIRNISTATHQALKRRAKLHGRSTEAEIREILDQAVKPEPQGKNIGEALYALGREFGGIELDIERSKEPIDPVKFE